MEIGHSKWDYSSLSEATPEAIATVVEANTIKKAIQLAHNVGTVTYEQAIKLIDVLEDKEI